MTFYLDNNTKTVWKLIKAKSTDRVSGEIIDILVCGICDGERKISDIHTTPWKYANLHRHSNNTHKVVCPNCVCLIGPEIINTNIRIFNVDIMLVNEYGGVESDSASFRPVIEPKELKRGCIGELDR